MLEKPVAQKAQVYAWLVHAFTMTGVVWAVLAMVAVMQGKPKMAFLWFLIALAVDGVDGTFARWAKVKDHVPWFDGSILDIIVDYLTYTFVPALFLYKFVDMPNQNWAIFSAIVICGSSMFCYCNTKMKSTDYYFVGFPAVWNIVILYFYILEFGPWTNVIITMVLSALTLSTIKFVHPFRVKHLMPVNIAATVVWLVTSTWEVAAHPGVPMAVDVLWWVSGLWIVGIGLWRTIRNRA